MKLIDIVSVIPVLVLFIVLVHSKNLESNDFCSNSANEKTGKEAITTGKMSFEDVKYIDWISRRFSSVR